VDDVNSGTVYTQPYLLPGQLPKLRYLLPEEVSRAPGAAGGGERGAGGAGAGVRAGPGARGGA
jgi:hypothetical protein